MGVSDPADILLPEDNNTSTAPLPRQRKSSFQDELLSHFERHLSDLGPRNQYPYLQQIDRNQRETRLAGHSLGGGGGEGAMSEELLTRRMGVQGERRVRGRWWQMIRGIHLLSQEGVMQRILQMDIMKRAVIKVWGEQCC